MSNPPQVASRKSEKWCKEHQYLTASEPNQKPIGVSISVPGKTDPGFGDSSRYPSVNTIDNPTKNNSPVPINNPPILTSETPTKYPTHVPKEFPSANLINMPIES